MKIAITINLTKDLLCNGLEQNVLFLYDLFQLAGYEPVLVSNSEEYWHPGGYNIVSLNEFMNDGAADVFIMASYCLNHESLDVITIRNSKCKFVLLHLGDVMVGDLLTGSQIMKSHCFTEIWTSPHHSGNKSYMETIYHPAKVKISPFIWSDKVLKKNIEKSQQENKDPYYHLGDVHNKTVCILEPNMGFQKHCLLPITICENLYNRNNEYIRQVHAIGADKFLKDCTIKRRVLNFNLAISPTKVCFNSRRSLCHALSALGKIVVSHNFDCDLNYLFLECFYLGVPLIHNSTMLKDYGYYYEGKDVAQGADRLYEAITMHDYNLEKYKQKSKEVIYQYSINNPVNIKGYQQLIEELVGADKVLVD